MPERPSKVSLLCRTKNLYFVMAFSFSFFPSTVWVLELLSQYLSLLENIRNQIHSISKYWVFDPASSVQNFLPQNFLPMGILVLPTRTDYLFFANSSGWMHWSPTTFSLLFCRLLSAVVVGIRCPDWLICWDDQLMMFILAAGIGNGNWTASWALDQEPEPVV